MERSHIALAKWLFAMYVIVTVQQGLSSIQLAQQIDVTQKSAWFLLHRIRECIEQYSTEEGTEYSGVCRNIAGKHADKYRKEFAVKIPETDPNLLAYIRMLLTSFEGKRLMYSELTSDPNVNCAI